jgi:ribonuclease D
MDLEEQTIDFESGRLRIRVDEYCGSLIQVLDGDRVELVHTTAKMYITSHPQIVSILISSTGT